MDGSGWERAHELEAENAALREELQGFRKMTEDYADEIAALRREIDARDVVLHNQALRIAQLEAGSENAALRERLILYQRGVVRCVDACAAFLRVCDEELDLDHTSALHDAADALEDAIESIRVSITP